MFGLDLRSIAILVAALIVLIQLILMFLLPFFVLHIRNRVNEIAADIDSIAKNIFYIASTYDTTAVAPRKKTGSLVDRLGRY